MKSLLRNLHSKPVQQNNPSTRKKNVVFMGTQAHSCTPCLTKSTESTLLTVYLIDKQDPSPPGQEKVNITRMRKSIKLHNYS